MMRKASKFTPVGKSSHLLTSQVHKSTGKTLYYLGVQYGASYAVFLRSILLYKPSVNQLKP